MEKNFFEQIFQSVCPPLYEEQKNFFSKFAFSAKKLGGIFYSDFQNFQMSHPGVFGVGPRKSGFQNQAPPPLGRENQPPPPPPPPPPGEVLVTFLYYSG